MMLSKRQKHLLKFRTRGGMDPGLVSDHFGIGFALSKPWVSTL